MSIHSFPKKWCSQQPLQDVEWWSILSDVSLDIIRFIEARLTHGSAHVMAQPLNSLNFEDFWGRFQLFFLFFSFYFCRSLSTIRFAWGTAMTVSEPVAETPRLVGFWLKALGGSCSMALSGLLSLYLSTLGPVYTMRLRLKIGFSSKMWWSILIFPIVNSIYWG